MFRINHFKKYGYKTSVIWQSDLKNLNNVKKKLIEFHGEKI